VSSEREFRCLRSPTGQGSTRLDLETTAISGDKLLGPSKLDLSAGRVTAELPAYRLPLTAYALSYLALIALTTGVIVIRRTSPVRG
jgi:hypothetical protein